jgi:putative ATP-dependent endonuclease of the OLD family
MKIRRVQIENYRSIRKADFKLGDLCALIGGNNCGKSNLLRAVNLVLGDRWPSVSAFEDRDFHGYNEAKDIIISIWFDEAREVRADIGDPKTFTGIQLTITRYKRNSGRYRKGDLRSEVLCIGDDGSPVEILKRTSGNARARPHPEKAKVSEEIRSATPAIMVDVDRNAKQHLSGSQWSILGRMLLGVSKKLKEDQQRFRDFELKFAEARELLRTDEFKQLHGSIVRNLELHTGIAGVDVTLDQIDPINLYKSFSILFKDPETPMPVDADRMGSGIQSAVVISLLQAYRELHKEDAILLFEEPELFLHPHGRGHLFRLLCDLSENGTQVVYTTHSQDFVDLTRINCVQMVKKSSDTGTTLRPPTDVILKADWKKKLKLVRHFGSPRNEVFFADAVILVEGTTEQALIAYLADLMEPPLDLDRLNCSVIEVGGKSSLPMFIKLMFALGKRLLVVYDTDADKTSAQDIETNQRRKKEIDDALDGRGALFECDPCVEEVAMVPGASRRDKEEKMREHLEDIKDWANIPRRLQALMEAVAETAIGTRIESPLEVARNVEVAS